jgi:molybdopterin-guanine dinucleotide biosynthesis protein A
VTAAKPQPGQITGVILAGGKARRMGGIDKGLLEFAGRPLIAWVIEGLAPQVGDILVSANRNLDAYRAFGYPVIPDTLADFQGPLAGLASAMAASPTPWILSVPCDGPRVPATLARRLAQALARNGAELAVASDGLRLQPVYALIPITLADSLQAFLMTGERRIDRWYAGHRMAIADFSDQPEAFVNLNAPEDKAPLL